MRMNDELKFVLTFAWKFGSAESVEAVCFY